MKRKIQKKKPTTITMRRLFAEEFFSLGDMVVQESVSLIDQGTREVFELQTKKK